MNKNGGIKFKLKLTPIRFPGGKSNALKQLDKYLPKDFSEYREPFVGGGSVALYLMQFNKTADYWINDLFYPVYCFWKVLYEQPENMVPFLLDSKKSFTVTNDVIIKGTPSKSAIAAKKLHTYCREKIITFIDNKDELNVACLWYILNKTSYSGMSMIGSYAPLAFDQNFTENCIQNLLKTNELMHRVKNVNITNLDYSELLEKDGDNVYIYCDPPYKIVHNLYGKNGDMHDGFDHQRFVNDIKQCKHKWMITYNDDVDIKEWFKEYKNEPLDLQYTMKAAKREGQPGSISTGKSGKKGKELLIFSQLKVLDNP